MPYLLVGNRHGCGVIPLQEATPCSPVKNSLSMPNIAIISSSVRIGRNSHRVALFFQNYLRQNALATVDLLDLYLYNFPLFDERLRLMKDPSPEILDFTD